MFAVVLCTGLKTSFQSMMQCRTIKHNVRKIESKLDVKPVKIAFVLHI